MEKLSFKICSRFYNAPAFFSIFDEVFYNIKIRNSDVKSNKTKKIKKKVNKNI